MERIRKLIRDLFFHFGYSIRKTLVQKAIDAQAKRQVGLSFLAESIHTSYLPISRAYEISLLSKSQLGQDLLALSTVGFERKGFFVEFGATNGVELSNTHLLEKEFGWSGILCEPARKWHKALRENRLCVIDTRCVYSSSGFVIPFSETSIGELSTISKYLRTDSNDLLRKQTSVYTVETVSLEDLLSSRGAPKFIDFLSVDTEGSEYEILKAFDFNKYEFGLICVEHNYTSSRKEIHDLLSKNGYSQIYEEYSDFDDWYVGRDRKLFR